MKIRIADATHAVTYQLDGSSTARSLYEQLPLSVEVGNYSSNEKVFTPTKELDTSKVTNSSGSVGDMAYFSPWGNVALYFDHDAGPYQGLYAMGNVTSGQDQISQLSGTVTIEAQS